jgi:glycylpeptide N-tetradecanoyltransferase
MAESKQVDAQETRDKQKETMAFAPEEEEGGDDDEKSLPAPLGSAKSKKKKKRSKLKSLLARKPNEEIALSEVEEALESVTLEERKTLSKEDAAKLEFMIKKMTELMPGGRKNIGDHKFWKTQPVIKFGKSYP